MIISDNRVLQVSVGIHIFDTNNYQYFTGLLSKQLRLRNFCYLKSIAEVVLFDQFNELKAISFQPEFDLKDVCFLVWHCSQHFCLLLIETEAQHHLGKMPRKF